MSITTKDLNLIADTLADHRTTLPQDGSNDALVEGYDTACRALAEALARLNPHFDQARFSLATIVGSEQAARFARDRNKRARAMKRPR